MNSLEELVRHVAAERWCFKWGCTTCGAEPLRQYIRGHRSELVEQLKATRVSGLHDQAPSIAVGELLRFILLDLYGLEAHGVADPTALDKELAGSEAGEVLAEMHRHSASVTRERQERVEQERLARADKIRQKELAQKRHEQRKRESATRKAKWVQN